MSENTYPVTDAQIRELLREVDKQLEGLKQALEVIDPARHTKHGMHLRIEHSVEIAERCREKLRESVESITRPDNQIPF